VDRQSWHASRQAGFPFDAFSKLIANSLQHLGDRIRCHAERLADGCWLEVVSVTKLTNLSSPTFHVAQAVLEEIELVGWIWTLCLESYRQRLNSLIVEYEAVTPNAPKVEPDLPVSDSHRPGNKWTTSFIPIK
jgi:hypothetical protein